MNRIDSSSVLFSALRLPKSNATLVREIFGEDASLVRTLLALLDYETLKEYRTACQSPTATISSLKKALNKHLKNYYGSKFQCVAHGSFGSLRDEFRRILPDIYAEYCVYYKD